MKTEQIVREVIAKLKGIDIDGETMQYIIDEVGMTQQMQRQLIMSNSVVSTQDLLDELIQYRQK
jgi:hypothetical protein